MDNTPIYGCRNCNTTVGRQGCWEHRDKPKLLIGDIPKCTAEISICDLRIAQLETELAEARKDNEELDGTDAAHPAWWRGNDAGVAQVCEKINAILDGADVFGTASEPWESTRRRVTEARRDSERLDWIEADMAKLDEGTAIYVLDGSYCYPYLVDAPFGGVGEKRFANLRAAINAAMKGGE